MKNQLNTTDLVGVRNDLILNELGFEIRELDSYEKSMISGKGVLVVSIQNGSIIHKSRMEPGYIIKSINGKPIDSAKDMADFFENNRGKPILLEGLYLNYPGEFPYTFIIPF